MPTQDELRQQITATILEYLEKGTAPWRRPWSTDQCSGPPTNAMTNKRYTGVNPLLLQIATEKHGFTSNYWATYRQWQEMGFQVMKRPDHIQRGQWGTNIVFCKPFTKSIVNDAGESHETGKEKAFYVLKSHTVFSADQCDGPGIERCRAGTTTAASGELEARFERAEQVVQATGADIRFGGNRAFYSLDCDYIQMPSKSQFATPDFWDTLLHEICHWAEPRLGWDRKQPENTYALGELIAELGSCFLAGDLGLPINENLDNHAAYLQYWLEEMKADSRFIFRATSQASKAADFILSFSRVEEPEPLLV